MAVPEWLIHALVLGTIGVLAVLIATGDRATSGSRQDCPPTRQGRKGTPTRHLRAYEGIYKTGVHAQWNVTDSGYQEFKINS